LRIGLGASAVAVGANGGRRGVVDSAEDVDALLLFCSFLVVRGEGLMVSES
jgi:hypothetical protein